MMLWGPLRALARSAPALEGLAATCSLQTRPFVSWNGLPGLTEPASTQEASSLSRNTMHTRSLMHTSSTPHSSTPSSPAADTTTQPETSTLTSSDLPSTSGSNHLQIPEDAMQALLQPISKGSKYNGALSPFMMSIDNRWFLDPAVTTHSMIRALHVMKYMLRQDAHVLIVNSNPLMKPLMEEAARCCVNPNVWFYSDKWTPGTLTNHRYTRSLFKDSQQPNRKLFQSKGIKMTNVHCPEGDPDLAKIRMSYKDKMRLFDHSRRRLSSSDTAEQLLIRILECERHLAKMETPGTLTGRIGKIRLVVVLDPTYNSLALQESQQKNIFSIGLVNHHKELSAITYPVFARDNHPSFQHFFLDRILKVANVR